MGSKIIGDPLANIPWEDRPSDNNDIVWRFSGNPIIDWNPIPKAARVYNSAIVPFKGEFAGVFRADQKNGRATLFAGFSKDALNIELNPDPINWIDEDGNPKPTSFAYDPRVVKIEDIYFINWYFQFSEIDEGVIYCEKCSRWYPIIETIPQMLPDELREKENEVAFLKKWESELKTEIKERGKPFNLKDI